MQTNRFEQLPRCCKELTSTEAECMWKTVYTVALPYATSKQLQLAALSARGHQSAVQLLRGGISRAHICNCACAPCELTDAKASTLSLASFMLTSVPAHIDTCMESIAAFILPHDVIHCEAPVVTVSQECDNVVPCTRFVIYAHLCITPFIVMQAVAIFACVVCRPSFICCQD